MSSVSILRFREKRRDRRKEMRLTLVRVLWSKRQATNCVQSFGFW